VIALREVTYAYPGAATPALERVSLDVAPGEFVVVAGGSGSGKSTLLRAVAGLVPHFHGGTFSGRAIVCGVETRAHGAGELAAHVGTLFQDPETQVVMGTVRGELGFPVENRGWSPAEVARAVEEVALALAVDALLDRPTAELSGGELQRVALGATLVGRPSVVCLDEPTSQLDPVAGDELVSLLRRLNEDFDVTVLLAEHRLERCLGVADRVVALDRGRVVCDSTPEGFLEWAVRDAPALATPGARLLCGLGLPPVPGVKRARAALRGSTHLHDVGALHEQKRRANVAALRFDRVWHEIERGPAILRGLTLEVAAGERVALMGRNGAGKSTLLRHAAGLMQPTRGRITTHGRVALLLQNPTDYLIHDTVAEESVPSATLATLGLDALTNRNPRDLSGGEKQRLALGIVLHDLQDPPAVLCLDEPTRGMDRGAKRELAALLKTLPGALIVATHDPEFAAEVATRVVLVADGRVIADGPPHELLAGGTYFATETARILSGAALLPEEGVALLATTEVPA
jgi:energy-coupling factor transport system ATP-binding protein